LSPASGTARRAAVWFLTRGERVRAFFGWGGLWRTGRHLQSLQRPKPWCERVREAREMMGHGSHASGHRPRDKTPYIPREDETARTWWLDHGGLNTVVSTSIRGCGRRLGHHDVSTTIVGPWPRALADIPSVVRCASRPKARDTSDSTTIMLAWQAGRIAAGMRLQRRRVDPICVSCSKLGRVGRTNSSALCSADAIALRDVRVVGCRVVS